MRGFKEQQIVISDHVLPAAEFISDPGAGAVLGAVVLCEDTLKAPSDNGRRFLKKILITNKLPSSKHYYSSENENSLIVNVSYQAKSVKN